MHNVLIKRIYVTEKFVDNTFECTCNEYLNERQYIEYFELNNNDTFVGEYKLYDGEIQIKDTQNEFVILSHKIVSAQVSY